MILRNACFSFFWTEVHNTVNKSKTEFADGVEQRYPMNFEKTATSYRELKSEIKVSTRSEKKIEID